MRRLVIASAILATLLTMPLGSAAATPNPSVATTDSDRATAALEYLLAAQGSNGSIDGRLGETADFVIAAAAAGYDPSTLHGCGAGSGALSFIATASDADAAIADAAQTGKAILAVVAAGGDPASFLGRDLSARLNALYDSATGAYGDGSTYSQSFAILADVASGGSVPTKATEELVALQNVDDGAWSFGSAPVAVGLGDTNSTAMALMALDGAGIGSADAKALAYLKSQQQDDGGFIFAAMYGPPADPDSDALVVEAIVAAGQDPAAAAWSRNSNNVLDHLRSAQGADGGFVTPGWGESAFTTTEIPAALMRVPYGAPVHPTAGRSVPTSSCPTATPTPSPTPTPRPTPTASPTPTPTATPQPTVRPTARPTARPTDPPASPSPTDSIEPTPTPEPTATPTSAPTASPSELVAGSTAAPAAPGPGNSDPFVPPALLYGGAALAGLVIVVGGGWFLITRPTKP